MPAPVSRLLLVITLATIAPGCAPRPAPSAAAPAAPVLVPAAAARVMARARDGRAAVTLVHVWATWCGPCREEFPELLSAARAHAHQDVRLLLVSADSPEQSDDAIAFLREHAVTDTSYLKDADEAEQAFVDGLDRRWSGALPATLVVDRDGRTVAFWEGASGRDRWEREITQALGGAQPS